MIQRALLRTFFRELIRRARSDTVQAAEKCSRQSVRLVAQIKQPMRAQNRKRAPASPLIIWPAIPHGLGNLPSIQALANIPGREELLARLLGVMLAPVSGFARALAALSAQQGEQTV